MAETDVNAPTAKTKKARLNRSLSILVALFLISIVLFLYPIVTRRTSQGQSRVRETMKDIQVATGHFRSEYDAFPILSKSSDQDIELLSQGRYLAAILGEDLELNSRKIKFLDGLPQATDGRGGLLKVEDDQRLVDRWGEMYHIILDTNEDNRIDNTELEANPTWVKKHGPPALLNTTSLIYSSGPDRDPKTWEDNVCSWR